MTINKNGWGTTLKSLFDLGSGLCSIATLAGLLVYGGRYVEKTDANTEAIRQIQNNGSTAMQRHQNQDDERVEDIKRRLAKVEDAVVMLSNQNTRLAVIDERLDTFAKKFIQIQDEINELMKKRL